MPLLPPPPFAPSSWPGPSGPFKCHSLSTHLLFRFPVHRLYIHWSRHSLSLPCSFCPPSVLQTSVGRGPLIPSAFYTPPALNYPPYPLYLTHIRLEGPEDPHRTNSRFLRSRDPAHASLPLAQTPWGLTGRAWLQAGAQQVAIVVSHN